MEFRQTSTGNTLSPLPQQLLCLLGDFPVMSALDAQMGTKLGFSRRLAGKANRMQAFFTLSADCTQQLILLIQDSSLPTVSAFDEFTQKPSKGLTILRKKDIMIKLNNDPSG